MKDLRLIGVHEDGEHVLLSDVEGQRYRVPLDEAMRAAARRDRPRLGQLQIEIDGGLRPRDVQALIRAGLSTEEVADRAGWTVQKVQRFEGPVLAEREYVANQARACVVGTTRVVSGPSAGTVTEQTLGSRAEERFKGRGVAGELVRWDSSRLDDGRWTVTATFPAGGRERTAAWTFDPRLKSLLATNDEARWLSEESRGDSAIPTPHVATTANATSAVFDVEAEGGVEEARPTRRPGSQQPIDLMAAMREQSHRSRRGRGRGRPAPTHTPGEESPRDDALPLEELALDPADAPEPPAARGKHPVAAHLDDRDHAPAELAELADTPEPDPDEPETTEPTDEVETQDSTPGPEPEPVAPPTPARKPSGRRNGRKSVPSWDDIMFGGGRGANSS
ncbi:hypothetical protein N798_04670 [Knoellia flava TL1]|uniref:DNA-binding protein n=2 Tax=Knoellia flava TaxID=913969 RepID=A0A8H9KRZ4_9MICO|nr:septation protein SepH [Knoellia flava]KGN34467.1 hypothetical protein N798_04670 [Knoellia flava TL1]GGB90826.1 DNA-binding protein [Knoellia flava]